MKRDTENIHSDCVTVCFPITSFTIVPRHISILLPPVLHHSFLTAPPPVLQPILPHTLFVSLALPVSCPVLNMLKLMESQQARPSLGEQANKAESSKNNTDVLRHFHVLLSHFLYECSTSELSDCSQT